MTASRIIALLATVLLVLAACATSVQVPEIPILDESVPFKAAKREAEEKPPVKIVEVPKPLPLPGQLKPVPQKKERPKDDKQPKERVAEANALAKIDPVKDGYINAIQVYPYTKGALYQLYAAPSQVTDIALEAGEKLVSVSAGDTVRWVVTDLIAYGEIQRPTLGVQPAPDAWTRELGLRGALIARVVEGSGAERAGIEGIHRNRFGQVEIGDTVIALDGQEVTSSADLILMLEKRKPGERVRLTLERNGRRREVESELGSSRE